MHSTNKSRLLVVDDEPGIALAIYFLLQDVFEIVTAGTAADALAHAATPFDLILLDLCMPDVERFELLERLQSLVPQTPIAILSAACEWSTHEEALRRGAVAFIEKPFSRQELLTQIQGILNDR